MSHDDLEVHSDQIWPLHERLALIAYDLEKDPQYADTARELWAITVSLEGVLRGVIQEEMDEEDDEDDFVDYGDMPE